MKSGEQTLTYETGSALLTKVGVFYHEELVYGAAVEVVRTDEYPSITEKERVVLTVPEALLLIEHLGKAVREVLNGADQFSPVEES